MSEPTDPLSLTVPVTRPYNAAPLLAYLRVRAIDGVECVEGQLYRRVVRIAGESRMLTVDFSQIDKGGGIVASCAPGRGLDKEAVRAVVLALTDADSPIAAVEERLSEDTMLIPLVRRNTGAHIPGAVDPFELTVRAILGQQVSVAAARTFASRLAARWGEGFDGTSGFAFAFPGPEQLVGAALEEVGLSKSRATAIRELCDAVLGRRIDLREGRDLELTVEALLSVKGIGPWTAAYVALRGLGDRDAIPLGDLGLRQALGGAEAWPESVLATHAERWRPWRGYAAVHLWNTFLRP